MGGKEEEGGSWGEVGASTGPGASTKPVDWERKVKVGSIIGRPAVASRTSVSLEDTGVESGLATAEEGRRGMWAAPGRAEAAGTHAELVHHPPVGACSLTEGERGRSRGPRS